MPSVVSMKTCEQQKVPHTKPVCVALEGIPSSYMPGIAPLHHLRVSVLSSGLTDLAFGEQVHFFNPKGLKPQEQRREQKMPVPTARLADQQDCVRVALSQTGVSKSVLRVIEIRMC